MKYLLACQMLVFVLVQSAAAEVVLDQEYMLPFHTGVNYYMDYPGDYLAQTFTVRNTGKLASVGVQASVSGRGQFVDDLHVRVTRVGTDGYPLANEVLAEAAIAPIKLPVEAGSSPATITDVDLSSWHVPVSMGDRLAILLSSNHTYYSPEQGPHYVWFFYPFNRHPGGEFSIYSPNLYGPKPLRDIYLPGIDKTVDAGFRVHVDVVPEPDTLLLLACGAVACFCWAGDHRPCQCIVRSISIEDTSGQSVNERPLLQLLSGRFQFSSSILGIRLIAKCGGCRRSRQLSGVREHRARKKTPPRSEVAAVRCVSNWPG